MKDTTKQIVARLALTAADDGKLTVQQVIDAATKVYGKPMQSGTDKKGPWATFETKTAKYASYVNVYAEKSGVTVMLEQHYTMDLIDVASAKGNTAEALKSALENPKHERNFEAAADTDKLLKEMAQIGEHL